MGRGREETRGKPQLEAASLAKAAGNATGPTGPLVGPGQPTPMERRRAAAAGLADLECTTAKSPGRRSTLETAPQRQWRQCAGGSAGAAVAEGSRLQGWTRRADGTARWSWGTHRTGVQQPLASGELKSWRQPPPLVEANPDPRGAGPSQR